MSERSGDSYIPSERSYQTTGRGRRHAKAETVSSAGGNIAELDSVESSIPNLPGPSIPHLPGPRSWGSSINPTVVDPDEIRGPRGYNGFNNYGEEDMTTEEEQDATWFEGEWSKYIIFKKAILHGLLMPCIEELLNGQREIERLHQSILQDKIIYDKEISVAREQSSKIEALWKQACQEQQAVARKISRLEESYQERDAIVV